MKAARLLCLILGGVSLVLAALALFVYYTESLRQLSALPDQPPASLESKVAAAEDLPSLKIICLSLARFQESTYPEYRELSAQAKRFMRGTILFLFGWGTVSCFAFFYLFNVLRRNAQGGQ